MKPMIEILKKFQDFVVLLAADSHQKEIERVTGLNDAEIDILYKYSKESEFNRTAFFLMELTDELTDGEIELWRYLLVKAILLGSDEFTLDDRTIEHEIPFSFSSYTKLKYSLQKKGFVEVKNHHFKIPTISNLSKQALVSDQTLETSQITLKLIESLEQHYVNKKNELSDEDRGRVEAYLEAMKAAYLVYEV